MKKSEKKKEELFTKNGERFFPGCSSTSLNKQCLAVFVMNFPLSMTRALRLSQVVRLYILET